MSVWDARRGRLHHPGFFGFANIDSKFVERGLYLAFALTLLLLMSHVWPEDR